MNIQNVYTYIKLDGCAMKVQIVCQVGPDFHITKVKCKPSQFSLFVYFSASDE